MSVILLFIAIFIFFILVFGVAFRFFLRSFLSISKKHQDDNRRFYRNDASDNTRQGREYKPQKKVFGGDEGEYVDFEEIE